MVSVIHIITSKTKEFVGNLTRFSAKYMKIFDRNDLLNFGGGLTIAFGANIFHDQRCYYEMMETYLSTSNIDREAHIEKNIQNFTPVIREYVEKHKYNPRWEQLFPNILRTSFVVSIMSSFEHYLNNICSDIEIILRTPISHRFLKGGSIKRGEIFLTQVAKLNKPTLRIWKSLHEVQRLRNLLVHNGGILEASSDQNEVHNLEKKLPGLVYSEEEGFILHPSLCLHYLDLVEDFHGELEVELKEVCERIQKFEKNA